MEPARAPFHLFTINGRPDDEHPDQAEWTVLTRGSMVCYLAIQYLNVKLKLSGQQLWFYISLSVLVPTLLRQGWCSVWDWAVICGESEKEIATQQMLCLSPYPSTSRSHTRTRHNVSVPYSKKKKKILILFN